ncbi:hypothetical protein GCM10007103_22060 [Salinimicrobium marinum]|uniref:Uncharacterized protein n=1 Tax=Salinimicrobium marinum TaxID=680283 RepID=A0A918VZI6_9FLAO|nr:hypothetical protein [Salinimicrobium marinum]GHA40206.1 hypothetical protein GCM10007103_22060 [Salinimicrobium marinum]
MTLEDFYNRPVAFTEFVVEILLNNGCSLDFGTAYGMDYLTVTSEGSAGEKQFVVALRSEEIRKNLLPVLRFTEEKPERKIFLCVLNPKDKQFLEGVLMTRTNNVEVYQLPLIDRYRFYRREFESRKRKI